MTHGPILLRWEFRYDIRRKHQVVISGIWSLPVDNALVVYVYDIHNKWFQVTDGSFYHDDKFLSSTVV